VRGLSRIASALLPALLAAACGAAATPTPDDMTGLLNELESHGAHVEDILAGDAGCPDSELHSNASRLTVTSGGRDYDVYLFRWRRPTDYDAANAAFQDCVGAFTTARGSVDVEILEVAPWRAFGGGWTAGLKDAIESSLSAAAAGE